MQKDGEVTDYSVAEFLSDRKRSRHLDPYLAQESSVADAARQLGVSAQRMHYWTRKLLQLELIENIRTQVNGRHHSSIYRSVADSFSVPLELLPTSDVETLGLYFEPIWQSFLQSVSAAGRKYASGWCVRYSRISDQAAFHIVPTGVLHPDPPFTNSWARLSLTRDQARGLKLDLERLIQHYLEQSAETHAHEFIAHVALVEAAGGD